MHDLDSARYSAELNDVLLKLSKDMSLKQTIDTLMFTFGQFVALQSVNSELLDRPRTARF